MSKVDANNYVNRELKEQYSFLKEVDKFALTNAVYALENGYKRFFQKKGGHPNFKSKHHSGKSILYNKRYKSQHFTGGYLHKASKAWKSKSCDSSESTRKLDLKERNNYKGKGWYLLLCDSL